MSHTSVTIRGLGFRDSQYTYLDEWGIPAGGDWALHRGGALFVEGAEKLAIDQCSFTLLDGNAVFFSGYAFFLLLFFLLLSSFFFFFFFFLWFFFGGGVWRVFFEGDEACTQRLPLQSSWRS